LSFNFFFYLQVTCTHKMVGEKRNFDEISDDLDALLVAVDDIILRINQVSIHETHILPGLMQELEKLAELV